MNPKIFTLFAFAIGVAAAGNAAAAGKTILSHKGNCQMAVPDEWKVGTLLKSMAESPDKSMSAVISTGPPNKDLAFARQVMEKIYAPKEIFEDSPQRLFYAYEVNGKPGFYVGVPSGQGSVCGAQITFRHGQEAQARKIAASVAQAR